MRRPGFTAGEFAIVCSIAFATSVRSVAQCPGAWDPSWGENGKTGAISALAEWDPDGSGPLPPRIVAGISTTPSTTSAGHLLCEWRDGSWYPIASEVNGRINAILSLPNSDIIVGGDFTGTSSLSFEGRIARLSNGTWSAMSGIVSFGNSSITDLARLTDGRVAATGPGLRNNFGLPMVVLWDGVSWISLPATSAAGQFIEALPAGEFVAASSSGAISRWTGRGWVSMGTGVNGGVSTLRALADGSLLVGGGFTKAGGVACTGLARWLGGSQWVAFGGALSAQGQSPVVSAIDVLPNGNVLIGGSFFNAGAVNADYVARWDGTQWNSLPQHVDAICDKIIATQDGNAVLAGGFHTAGGYPADGVALWSPSGKPQLSAVQLLRSASEGGTLVLSVSANSGSSPVSVQWFRNGTPLLNGPGGAGPTPSVVFGGVQTGVLGSGPILLTITNADPGLSGAYSVRLSNSCGSTVSSATDVEVASVCDGDLNRDGLVDDADFSIFVVGYDELVCP
ncbi:MAG: immunoglobulin domain-containing protein [Phycisphaerales bacterium]|nr:immunoglobulin domain-containing protein [Phycisphaerales bacterium]